jgi:hypothetical protein
MLEAGMTFSFGQLVIDDEIAGMVKRILKGIGVDRELMGVEVIKKVGIGNNFLTEPHTIERGAGSGNDHRPSQARSLGTERIEELDRICQRAGSRAVEDPRAETAA